MDAWDQFQDAPTNSADPWSQFQDAQISSPSPAQSTPKEPGFFEYYSQPSQQKRGITAPITDFFVEPMMQALSGTAGSSVGGWRGILGSPDKVSSTADKFTYEPRSPAGKAGAALLSWPFKKIAQGGYWIGDKAREGSQYLGASPEVSAGIGAAVNTGFQVLAPGAIVKTVKAVKGGISRANSSVPPVEESQAGWYSNEKPSSGLAEVPKKAPTLDELSAQSQAAYKAASDAGVVISPNSMKSLKAKVNTMLNKAGLDKDLHPDTSAALKRINETKGPVSLDQLETLRKIASDAKGSIKPADRRLASAVVDEMDNYIESLSGKDVISGDASKAALLKDARDMYSRKMKATEINDIIERAKISAPNFSASGMENALRTEFRALAKNKTKMRRFTPEEQAAIKKVAVGGPAENALRMLGKFAPTGVVSTGLSTGTGFLMGGPAGAAVMPAVGTASRYAATKMTMKNALAAEEIMRRGKVNNLATSMPKNELVK